METIKTPVHKIMYSPITGEILIILAKSSFYAKMPIEEIYLMANLCAVALGILRVIQVNFPPTGILQEIEIIKQYPTFYYLNKEQKERLDKLSYEVQQTWAELRYKITQSLLPCLN